MIEYTFKKIVHLYRGTIYVMEFQDGVVPFKLHDIIHIKNIGKVKVTGIERQSMLSSELSSIVGILASKVDDMECSHKNTMIWEPHMAGARKCKDCNMVYNPNRDPSWFFEKEVHDLHNANLRAQVEEWKKHYTEAKDEIIKLRGEKLDLQKENRELRGSSCDLGYDWNLHHENDKIEKLKKENEELREALDWALSFIDTSFINNLEKVKEIRTKFSLDKNTGR